ncbi:MAG TPA: prohibitin family protein [Candidatus Limnocylindrales bacterium]|nr:prohibitin family protein [Candidatus Limnocylindrales bacterium]
MNAFRADGGDDTPRELAGRLMNKLAHGVGTLLIVALVVILLYASVAYVPAGHVGVLTLFGRVTGDVLPEGTHIVNPFKVNNTMSIRTQELKETASVPSDEGLVMTLDTSLLFRLSPEKAAEVFQKIGPNFVEVVVEPTLRASIRSVTASHSANALYTGGREQVAQQINAELTNQLASKGIEVQSILLRDIQLPQMLKTSIEAKQQAEQDALRMAFVLQKEKQEADRKRIEAQGIRDFQTTVAQGISAQLLEWKGIEATERLANSANSKLVIIGNPKNGLPLVLEPK